MTADLFETVPDVRPSREAMAEGAVLLRGFARPFESELIAALREIVAQAPFRRMFTPGRSPDVGGDDQLRQRRLGHGPQRLSL